MTSVRMPYQVEGLPIFRDRMYPMRAEARSCPRGDVVLVKNLETGLVYNRAFRPDVVTYDSNYQNEQGLSPLFHQHLDAVAELVGRTMGKSRLVEVGCGKGHFLEPLASNCFDICGFDPPTRATTRESSSNISVPISAFAATA